MNILNDKYEMFENSTTKDYPFKYFKILTIANTF